MGEILTCTGTCIQHFSKDGRWLVTGRLDGHEAFFPKFLREHSNCAGSTSIFQQPLQFSVLGTCGPCDPCLWTISSPESNVVLWFCSALRIWIYNSEVHRCYCVAGIWVSAHILHFNMSNVLSIMINLGVFSDVQLLFVSAGPSHFGHHDLIEHNWDVGCHSQLASRSSNSSSAKCHFGDGCYTGFLNLPPCPETCSFWLQWSHSYRHVLHLESTIFNTELMQDVIVFRSHWGYQLCWCMSQPLWGPPIKLVPWLFSLLCLALCTLYGDQC